MDNNQLHSYLLTLEDDPLYFRGGPLWDWQMGFPIEWDVNDDAIHLMQSYYPSDPLFPLQGLTYEVNSMFDGEIGLWDDKRDDVSSSIEPNERSLICGENRKECDQQSREKKGGERCKDQEKALTFEEVSRYFYMTISKAAKELRVGLTLLKRRCRELGIPRWPHRKMKSLQNLINNVHELVKHEGEEEQLRSTIGLLEQERMMMEREPSIQLEGKTKKLRKACFKAKYKKRRLMAALQGAPKPQSPTSLYLVEGGGFSNHPHV